jgi:hypothetical protein
MDMKKLEDIPKKNVFEVPDRYFEKLPSIIQSRVSSHSRRYNPTFRFALRFALPVILIAVVAAALWISRPDSEIEAQSILATIETEDLVTYLKESDFTTEELLDAVELGIEDANQIEDAVYEFQLDDSELENILNE